MKIVLQRVSQAAVTVESQVVSSIKNGYFLLVGVSTDDTMADVNRASHKVLSIRVFGDADAAGNPDNTLWKKNIKDANGEILSVSQFTLLARTKKGTKPDLHMAQKGHLARELYDEFLKQLRQGLGEGKVQDGQFGAMMSCALTNEGPITIVLDTKE